jgi:pyridinium-3,5-biscarboxylic acid mononucleotide sulfurtransferase
MIETVQKTSVAATPPSPAEKERNLRSMMRDMKRVLVAYSGGVDSSYLAAVATEELSENALCVTGISPSVSDFQRRQSAEIANRLGFNFQTVDTSELADPNYQKNGADRCFFCKDELYSVLGGVSTEFGFGYIVDGTNADDLRDHRPGRVAAANHNVRSPLAETGLTKSEIRELSRKLGLPTWDLPASPCLSSRIAHGVPVTIERLSRVERAEEVLRKLGFVEFRVRLHDKLARIEIAKAEMPRMFETEIYEDVSRTFSKIGFKYITLDLQGFRSGSMNLKTAEIPQTQ